MRDISCLSSFHISVYRNSCIKCLYIGRDAFFKIFLYRNFASTFSHQMTQCNWSKDGRNERMLRTRLQQMQTYDDSKMRVWVALLHVICTNTVRVSDLTVYICPFFTFQVSEFSRIALNRFRLNSFVEIYTKSCLVNLFFEIWSSHGCDYEQQA
jgi:hypothetical protein